MMIIRFQGSDQGVLPPCVLVRDRGLPAILFLGCWVLPQRLERVLIRKRWILSRIENRMLLVGVVLFFKGSVCRLLRSRPTFK